MKTQIPLEERYGYLILDTPELKAKHGPIQVTDEVFSGIAWRLTNNAHLGFSEEHTYRRRISVGEGFELVPFNEAEPLLSGDGMKSVPDGQIWDGTYNGVYWWQALNGNCSGRYSVLAFRRRKVASQPKSDGWVKLSDRKAEYPCFVTDGAKVYTAFKSYTGQDRPNTNGASGLFDLKITHWKPCELPALPVPVKSDYDVAFDAAFSGSTFTPSAKENARMMFQSGVAFQKSQQQKS